MDFQEKGVSWVKHCEAVAHLQNADLNNHYLQDRLYLYFTPNHIVNIQSRAFFYLESEVFR